MYPRLTLIRNILDAATGLYECANGPCAAVSTGSTGYAATAAVLSGGSATANARATGTTAALRLPGHSAADLLRESGRMDGRFAGDASGGVRLWDTAAVHDSVAAGMRELLSAV